jgi:single-strand DNA-binding protein
MSYSKTITIGNLARDPELRFSPKGSAVCAFSIAVNRKWKTDGGEEREEVSFIDHTAFGKTAELIGKHFKKGSPIFVEGRLKQDSWDDKTTGQKRTKLGVFVESFQFFGGRKKQDQDDGSTSTQRSSTAARTGAATPPPEEDDVPF